MNSISNTLHSNINILYQSSDLYAPIMGVSLTSLFENNRHIDDMTVYIVDGGISEENKEKISVLSNAYARKIYYIDAKAIDKRLSDKNVRKWRNSYAVYYKLYAIEFISESIDRLLAIDADTIINKPIDELYNIDLKGKTLGMVQDFIPYSYLGKIGMNSNESYYNSGIVLFDVGKWIANNCQERIEDYLYLNYDKIIYADQDAISIVLQCEILKLPLLYNYFTVFSALRYCLSFDIYQTYKLYDLYKLNNFYSIEEMIFAETNATIYHYEGGTVTGRPWLQGAKYPIFEFWDIYKSISPWNNIEDYDSQPTPFHSIEIALNRILPLPVYSIIYKVAYDFYWWRILSIRPNN